MARRSTNAFGEPMQGSKIQGAGALARARGYAYGSLSSQQRGAYGSQKNFQKAAEDSASRADSPSESDEAREERLKKQGREEILNRQPEFVKPVTKSTAPSSPRPPQKAAQNKPQSASMGEKWSQGVDIPGMGRMPLDRVPSPMKPAKPRVNWDTPTPSPEALRKARRKISTSPRASDSKPKPDILTSISSTEKLIGKTQHLLDARKLRDEGEKLHEKRDFLGAGKNFISATEKEILAGFQGSKGRPFGIGHSY